MFVITSCSSSEYEELKEKYEELEEDYLQATESLDAAKTEYMKQAKGINEILGQLSSITTSTIELRGGIEGGHANLTQVEQIASRIDQLKRKLDRIEELEHNNDTYKQIILNLKSTIVEKEKEIQHLKEEIREKNGVIDNQKTTIQEQGKTISDQQKTLESQIKKQAELLYQAGVKFEEIADNAPSISLKKNKIKVETWQSQMYKNALNYYINAKYSGYPYAESAILRVQQKIQ